ncbi:MAG: tetratricopeptide repeat protein, partial [Bacillaceae bacterium]
MYTEVEKAIQLRKEEKLKESNELLVTLAREYPYDPFVQYQCAWSFDALGEEREAVPYYELAIALGLAGEDLEGAFLGLGSTYRTLGEYEKSKKIFEQARKVFPEN